MAESAFECGARVWFGRYVDVEESTLVTTRTPEDALISKEMFDRLSPDTKFLAETIANLPDSFFYMDGSIKRGALYQHLKAVASWSPERVSVMLAKLARALSPH